jgi:hypothetical protein
MLEVRNDQTRVSIDILSLLNYDHVLTVLCWSSIISRYELASKKLRDLLTRSICRVRLYLCLDMDATRRPLNNILYTMLDETKDVVRGVRCGETQKQGHDKDSPLTNHLFG